MLSPMRVIVRGVVAALALGVVFGGSMLSAQPAAPVDGVKRVDPSWHALVGARVVVEPGEVIEDATVVVRDGVIVSVSRGGEAPEGARAHDCAGLTVHAGLIDAYVPVESPAPSADAPGRHWNAGKVIAERSSLDGAGLSGERRESLRGMGFTAVMTAPEGGIFRGTSAVVLLKDGAPEGETARRVVRDRVFDVVKLEREGWGSRVYPGSLMGAIAVVRQTLLDSAWYRDAVAAHERSPSSAARVEPNASFAALSEGRALLFDVDSELDLLRADAIAREFDRGALMVGSGQEFRRLGAVVEADRSLIVPVTMAEAPTLAREGERHSVSLRELMTWEQSPTNLRRLDAAGVRVAITSSKLRDGEEFMANLRRAMEHGLSAERALAMLTTVPAEMLGVADRMGSVREGMIANLVVVDGGALAEGSEIRDVWVDGVRHEVNPAPEVDLDGAWRVLDEGGESRGTLEIDGESVKAEIRNLEGEEVSLEGRGLVIGRETVDWVFDAGPLGGDEGGVAFVHAAIVGGGDRLVGWVEMGEGARLRWSAERMEEEPAAEGDADGVEVVVREGDGEGGDAGEGSDVPEALPVPFGAYGFYEEPAQEDVLVRGATIWTCGPGGVIEDGALLVRDGVVAWVGEADEMPARLAGGAREIDGRGKHVTPGLLDCHSHTGISGGVNEATQAVTSEVRIGDVIDPDDISWYRELAGGLTGANQLHGSANPIGGQNSVVKIRWGCAHPDGMRMEGAAPGIKFALGENVKQSNWGDDFTTRYPQSRMGVETIIRDRFIAAREYAAEREAWSRTGRRSRGAPPRRDLELEALAEILEGERLIHCHSYRQDEILMLCRVAEEFGFVIGTFQHVLEGYKVAEAIREHSLGGSSFSDWWAYKFEVYDAIPHNGAIMHDVGVTVTFNSDSDELARRMNTEAAKAVKYGGVAEEEALKFVTLNVAKQLRIEDRVGSLERGKDGDFVVWSGHPLSTMVRCERTFVDGRELFSLERDAELRARAASERRRIMAKLLASGEVKESRGVEGAPKEELIDRPPAEPTRRRAPLMLRALERRYDEMVRNGLDPEIIRCGDCGSSVHSAFTVR